MDIVYIRDLRINTVIGIYDWERQVHQPIVLDIEMATDVRIAAASDNIDDALNYKAVSKRVIDFVTSSQFLLVETLIEQLAELIQQEFSVSWVKIYLNKRGALRSAKDVGLVIERGNR